MPVTILSVNMLNTNFLVNLIFFFINNLFDFQHMKYSLSLYSSHNTFAGVSIFCFI